MAETKKEVEAKPVSTEAPKKEKTGLKAFFFGVGGIVVGIIVCCVVCCFATLLLTTTDSFREGYCESYLEDNSLEDEPFGWCEDYVKDQLDEALEDYDFDFDYDY